MRGGKTAMIAAQSPAKRCHLGRLRTRTQQIIKEFVFPPPHSSKGSGNLLS